MHACIDFMDTRDSRISCSIQIVCIYTVHSISKASTDFLYIHQVTMLFSDTTDVEIFERIMSLTVLYEICLSLSSQLL